MPSFRAQVPTMVATDAYNRGVLGRLLFCVGGGIGDQACAEPSIAYACENFPDAEITVACPHPEMFEHIYAADTFKIGERDIDMWQYHHLVTYAKPEHFSQHFMSSFITNSVDYTSMMCFRGQLPKQYRGIHLSAEKPDQAIVESLGAIRQHVIVHPGNSWKSKTFPSMWWQSLLTWLVDYGCTPVIVGTNKETVEIDVDQQTMLDIRDRTSLTELTYILSQCFVLLTNDSSPLHLASASVTEHRNGEVTKWDSQCWIGYIATAKHPDLLLHWRGGVTNKMRFGWRMRNFSKGGVWLDCQQSLGPLGVGTIDVRTCTDERMQRWLPDPEHVARWAASKWEGKQ